MVWRSSCLLQHGMCRKIGHRSEPYKKYLENVLLSNSLKIPEETFFPTHLTLAIITFQQFYNIKFMQIALSEMLKSF